MFTNAQIKSCLFGIKFLHPGGSLDPLQESECSRLLGELAQQAADENKIIDFLPDGFRLMHSESKTANTPGWYIAFRNKEAALEPKMQQALQNFMADPERQKLVYIELSPEVRH